MSRLLSHVAATAAESSSPPNYPEVVLQGDQNAWKELSLPQEEAAVKLYLDFAAFVAEHASRFQELERREHFKFVMGSGVLPDSVEDALKHVSVGGILHVLTWAPLEGRDPLGMRHVFPMWTEIRVGRVLVEAARRVKGAGGQVGMFKPAMAQQRMMFVGEV